MRRAYQGAGAVGQGYVNVTASRLSVDSSVIQPLHCAFTRQAAGVCLFQRGRWNGAREERIEQRPA